MNCPNCDSSRIEILDKEVNDIKGKYYKFMCLQCGTFIQREEFNKKYIVDKQVLME